MLMNNLKLVLRGISRHKGYAAISIAGLAAGLVLRALRGRNGQARPVGEVPEPHPHCEIPYRPGDEVGRDDLSVLGDAGAVLGARRVELLPQVDGTFV
jgi:hypothetical protein